MVDYSPKQLANDLLDMVARKHGVKSDYALAKVLGMPLQSVRNYRLGKTIPNATACLQFAEELHEDPLRVMAKFKVMAANSDRERGVWERYAGRVLLACFALAGSPMEGYAQNEVKAIDQNIHYTHK